MSQAKVDRYKQEKANRRQNMRKEKMKQALRRVVVGVLGLALIGWLGYSAYNVYETNKPKQTAEVDYTAITDYQTNLSTAAEE
ncbi:MAG: hypothetical protein Q4C52_00020 [Eubacteriales bacterium]|nr:hypothetical protein [Eubacteriales bacterium]